MIKSVTFGNPEKNCLKLEVQYRSYPEAKDYWDGNWLKTRIFIKPCKYRGKLYADLRSEEFKNFLAELENIRTGKNNTARFECMEEWLSILVENNTLDTLAINGYVKECLEQKDKQEFSITIPTNDLDRIICELKDLLREFPVVGEKKET